MISRVNPLVNSLMIHLWLRVRTRCFIVGWAAKQTPCFFVCVCLAYYQHGESDLYLQTYIYVLAGKWTNFSTDSVDRRFFNFWVDLSMGQNQLWYPWVHLKIAGIYRMWKPPDVSWHVLIHPHFVSLEMGFYRNSWLLGSLWTPKNRMGSVQNPEMSFHWILLG